MTKVSEIAQSAVGATGLLLESLKPALSGNAQIDAVQLVEQHRQLTAVIAELLTEIASHHAKAAEQIQTQTFSNCSVTPDISAVTAKFNNWDKRIIVGLFELQEERPTSLGFQGKEIHFAAVGLHTGNCTGRMKAISKLVPDLLSLISVNSSNLFRLTETGMGYAKQLKRELESEDEIRMPARSPDADAAI